MGVRICAVDKVMVGGTKYSVYEGGSRAGCDATADSDLCQMPAAGLGYLSDLFTCYTAGNCANTSSIDNLSANQPSGS